MKPWQIDPTKWIIWILSKIGLIRNLRRVPTEKIVLAELAEAKRRLAATLASPGLTEASATYIANAYRTLLETAQQWTQRKTEQLEVTREMLASLRKEISLCHERPADAGLAPASASLTAWGSLYFSHTRWER